MLWFRWFHESLRFWFWWYLLDEKVDGFIKNCDRTICLVLFGPKRYDAIFDRIRYLVSEKKKMVLHIVLI